MTPLQALHKRGCVVCLLPHDRLEIIPSPKQLTDKIRQYKAAIVDELRQHQAQMVVQAKELEGRILAALDSGRISPSDAEDKLSYVFRLTATTLAPYPPCMCGEVLLWCFPEEQKAALAPKKTLPLLCYRCHPPESGWVQFFLADENAPQPPPPVTEDLEHSGDWL